MPFLDNNVAVGLRAKDKFQVGRANVDNSQVGQHEKGVLIPFLGDPSVSWVYYDCQVECYLDSGIATHNRLPQVNNAADTLATCVVDDLKMNKALGGVNLNSNDQYQDTVQRMSHARYWFRLFGQALRIGYQVPIPKLKLIGGVPAVPYDRQPQFAYNKVVPGGNYGGAVLWHAKWSLWYTTAAPPNGGTPPAVDPVSGVLGPDVPKPPTKGIQVPFSGPDDNAQKSAPPQRKGATQTPLGNTPTS